MINVLAQKSKASGQDSLEASAVRTTLSDLIEAISDELGPGEEELISAAVLDLIQSGKVKWARSPKDPERLQF